MSERANNVRFYLISQEFGKQDLDPDGIKDFKNIPGDTYALEERGYYSVNKSSKVTLLQKGYEYLLGMILAHGPSKKVRFIIEKKDDTNIVQNWVRTSDTYVDMYSLAFDEESDNRSVSCTLINGGDQKIMDASFEDEFDVVGPDVPELPFVQVRFEPRLIFRRSKLSVADDLEIPSSPLTGGNPFSVVPVNIDFSSDTNISGAGGITLYGVREASGNTSLNFPGGCFYFVADRNRTLNVNFNGTFSVNGTLGTGDRIEFFLMVFDEGEDLNFVRTESVYRTQQLSTPGGGPFSFNENIEVDVLEGQSLAFVVKVFNLENYVVKIPAMSVITTEDSTFRATTAKAVKPFDMFQHLGGIVMGDPQYKFASEIFGPGGRHENKLLVHGTWLRNMPQILNEGEDDERRLQANLSINTLFEGYSLLEPLRTEMVTLDGEPTFNVDPFKTIQQNFTGVKIGQSMPDFKLIKVSVKSREVLGGNYFRKIKIGSETSGSNYGEVNNLYSICGYCEWSSPHTDSDGEYEVVSDIRTGAEDIELQRQLQYEDNPDVDAERDDDWFLVDAMRNGGEYVVKGWEHYYEEAPTNVYSAETNYNWPFAPVELLRGHGFKVNAGLKQVDDEYLKNPTGNCNLSLTTKKADEQAITSNAKFPISVLEKPRIRPMMVKCQFPMNDEILAQLRGKTSGVDNKAGLTEIAYGEEIIKGRIYEITTNETAELQLIQAVT